MSDNWLQEQREVLAQKQRELKELRSQILPAEPSERSVEALSGPRKTEYEQLRDTRSWTLALLVFVNFSNFCGSAYHLFTWPDSAEISVASDDVQVTTGYNGSPHYLVEVPLKEFPYEIQLNQQYRTKLPLVTLVNLFMAGVLISCYRRESRLKAQGTESE